MRSRWYGIIASVLFFLLGACKEEKKGQKEESVAEAYGERLTRAELREKVPNSISPEDSQTIAQNLIRDWVRERVLLKEARERLSKEEKDLSDRIEAYRRSLLIHLMERKIVEQELDTAVDRKELVSYYKEHKKDLILSGPALKYVHVQLVRDSAQYLPRFMKALRKDSSERVDALRSLCRDHAVDCSIKGDRWVRMGEFLTRMPLDIKNEKRFLKKRGLQRYEKAGNIFLLRILDHRPKKSVAPLNMVRDRVRSMILNERKERIVERVHKNALIDAREKNEVRIHED